MRFVIQKVKYAKLYINNDLYSSTGKGLLSYVGIGENDTEKDIKWMVDKMLGLRIFEENPDGEMTGKMNFSVKDNNFDIMMVSQFTLFGDARKGNRPSFTKAASIEKGKELYLKTVDYAIKSYNKDRIKTGVFQAYMEVEYINDGPITILLDSEKKF